MFIDARNGVASLNRSLAFASELNTLTLELVGFVESPTLHEAIDAVVNSRGSYGLNDDFAYPLSDTSIYTSTAATSNDR
ncbi:hypothetical protein [Halobacterium hubeiense]|uniref:hypothetical protein n=1 Tax=Halobacterium hubeiense TaxID=1407499 RepID=UPI003C720E1C